MKHFLFVVLLVSIPFMAVRAADQQSLEQMMSNWLNLERQKGKLQSGWSARQEQLDRRLKLLNAEQDSLEELLAETNESRDEVDERRLVLLQTQEKLEQEQALIESRLEQAVSSAQALNPRLPPPLRTQWEEKLPLLSSSDLSNSEKLERLLGLFKLVEEFNDRIALHRTSMALPGADGQTQNVMVTQLYLGAGQGWYVNDDGSEYGYGRATKLGWRWWHGDEASNELGRELDPDVLLRARAILENPTTAEFISFPLKL